MNSTAIIYALSGPIDSLLQASGQDPAALDCFRPIREELAKSGIRIVDTFICGDSIANPGSTPDRTMRKTLAALQSYHIPNQTDPAILELTARVLTDLHENSAIDLFIIIAAAPELLPLLRVIKHKNKRARVISPRKFKDWAVNSFEF